MRTLRKAGAGAAMLSTLLLFSCARPSNEIPITTSSDESKQLFLDGRTKLDNVQTEDAAALFEQAVQKDSTFALAYAYRAIAGGGPAVQDANITKAVSLSNKVTDGERLLILLVQAQLRPDPPMQRLLLDTLLAKYPLDPEVQYIAGSTYYYVFSEHKKALEHLSKAVSLDSSRAAAYNVMGYCEWEQGNLDAAEQAFKQYLKLAPENPNAYDSYADLLKKRGRFDESIEQYTKALAKDPKFSSSLLGIGDNYVFKGDYVKARESYQEMYDRAATVGDKLGALFSKAVSFVHQKDYKSALAALAERRDLAEKEGRAAQVVNSYATDGWILAESGKPKECMEKYNKAISMIDQVRLPDNIRENLKVTANSWLAYSLAVAGKFPEAQAAAERFKEDAARRQVLGEQRTANDVMGFIQFRQGKYDRALEYMGGGTSDDPYTMFHQAMSLLKKGDKTAGTEMLKKIKDWNINGMSLALVRPRVIELLAKGT